MTAETLDAPPDVIDAAQRLLRCAQALLSDARAAQDAATLRRRLDGALSVIEEIDNALHDWHQQVEREPV